ncbi:hypothetical protein BR93DRAFT_978619 [Coniochaeta sp. PMI_546]|nr:hypothetical protein BR93DRAFT_978619 [Coniochaeta sp. PMI_546]
MSCYLTALSVSNIYCRPPLPEPITQAQPGCHPTFEYPPICQAGTQHCNYTQGGGCCPLGTMCTTDGCADIIEFVFPAPETASAAACEVVGCPDVPQLISPGLLPTSSTLSDPGVATGSGTLQPATWTMTVTGSKTGEICDQSAMATAGVASGALKHVCVPGRGTFGTCSIPSVLAVAFFVLAIRVLF